MTSPRFTAPADPRPDDHAWPAMGWPPPAGTVLRGDTVELAVADPDADADGLFAALDHDAVWTHLAGRPDAPAAIGDVLRTRAAAGHVPWIVRLAATGAVVGTTSYLDVSVADARLEIGWTAYAPSVWAGPVNPECKVLLLGYAFDVLHAGRVQLKTDVRNVRSQQAIARMGARYEGVLRRYQRRSDGTVRDTVLFSVTAEDWPVVRDGLRRRLQHPVRRPDPHQPTQWPAG